MMIPLAAAVMISLGLMGMVTAISAVLYLFFAQAAHHWQAPAHHVRGGYFYLAIGLALSVFMIPIGFTLAGVPCPYLP